MASSSSSSLSSSLQQQFNDNSENNNNFDLLPRVDFDKTEIVASTKWMRLETLSYLVPNSNNEMASQSPQQQQQQQPRPAAALRKWDRVVRTTKHSETSVDAVVILATLRHSIANNNNIHNNGSNNSEKGDEIVCEKQYRPPINAFTLELPAGLIDLEDATTNTNNNGDGDGDAENNNLIQTQEAAIKSAALREFTEETGYIGTISSMTIGPPTYLSPGLTNECACLVKLDVDMTHEQNVRVYNNYMKDISSAHAHAHDDGDGGENRCANTMEESERERELTTVLFPKVGLLAALQELVQRKNNDDGGRRENVKLFTGLYSLAVGMSIMEEEMKLLASSSSGGSTTAMTTTASTNLPSLFSPDTNPILVASSPTTTATTTTTTDFPLVQLQFMDSNKNNRRIPTKSTSHAITSALRTSGFVLIQSPTLFPWELQQRALSAARQFLESEKALLSNKVVSHPSDPKVYAMLQGMDSVCFVDQDDGDSTTFTTTTKQHDLPTSSLAPDAAAAAAAAAISASDATILDDLKEWYKAMRQTRSVLLHCLAIGLGMSSSSSSSSSSEDDNDDDAQSYFNNLHQENNDALRLIKYHPGDDTTGNRCKEHSDYGTITLLLNDGVAGLEAHVNGKWRAVPYVEGSIVVNVGTLLSEWTRQELKATLHRVAGPASSDSCNTAMEREALMESVRRERISMAYFADPDVDVSVSLSNTNTAAMMMKKKEDGVLANDEKSGIETMSVSDYIRWRSGGSGQDRSGVAFTSLEESRLGEAEGSGAK